MRLNLVIFFILFILSCTKRRYIPINDCEDVPLHQCISDNTEDHRVTQAVIDYMQHTQFSICLNQRTESELYDLQKITSQNGCELSLDSLAREEWMSLNLSSYDWCEEQLERVTLITDEEVNCLFNGAFGSESFDAKYPDCRYIQLSRPFIDGDQAFIYLNSCVQEIIYLELDNDVWVVVCSISISVC